MKVSKMKLRILTLATSPESCCLSSTRCFPHLFYLFCYAISVGGSIFSLMSGLTHSDRR